MALPPFRRVEPARASGPRSRTTRIPAGIGEVGLAVIRTRVQKTRYMSELASWSTEVGLHVLHEASEGRIDWLIPPGLTRTDDIHADSTLISCKDGDLLWKVEVHRATDWRRPANDVVAGITRKLAKKFPYRG